MLMVLTAALALAAAEAPAAAPAAPQSPASAAVAGQPGLKAGERKVKVVCKEVTKPNSRFAKKQCFELEAYKRQQEIDRQAFEETQNRPIISTARGN